MREIKFRAWNTYHKKMYPVYMLNFESDLVYCKGDDYASHTFGLIDCKVMQFTGLQDGIRKDIYEGDILSVLVSEIVKEKDKEKYFTGEKIEAIWTVDFVSHLCFTGFMVYGLDRRFNRGLSKSCISNNQARVIGNIYENPELLK